MGIFDVPSEVRKLSFGEKQKLVEKLLTCPCIKDRDARDTVVRQLESSSHAIARHPSDIVDVTNIVDTCLLYPGKFRDLIEVVSFFDRHSIPVRKLKQQLFILFVHKIISPELYEGLIEIRAKITVNKSELESMYQNSLPRKLVRLAFENEDEFETFDSILEHLSQILIQADGTVPLLTFVHQLKSVAGPTVQDIAQWIHNAAEFIRVKVPDNTPGEKTISPTDSFHLLVKFEPDNNKPDDEFYIHAWFLRKRQGEKPECLFQEIKKDVYRLSDKPTFLSDLITECQNQISHNEFTVELFLPFTLLNHETCNVHQWELNAGYNNIPVIFRHPLVLRSYDRIYKPSDKKLETFMHMNMWKRNWEFGTRSPTITEVEIVKKKDYAVEAKDSIVRFEDATCLAMTSVPPKYDGSPQHIFKEMIDSGTSVALWSRVGIESSDEDIIGQAYRDLLLGETFFELPKLLLDKRRAALSDKSSLVNTLTLFYDNPCLLPRDIKLEPLAAAQERNKA